MKKDELMRNLIEAPIKNSRYLQFNDNHYCFKRTIFIKIIKEVL